MFGKGSFSLVLEAAGIWALSAFSVCGQSLTFAGNAQHTAQFAVPAQHLNHLRWSSAIETSFTLFHYGSPIVSASNTVVFAVISNTTFSVKALEGTTGRLKYTLTTGFRSANVGWGVVFGPVFTEGPQGLRLYYPDAGGTVSYIDNADSDTPTTPVQLCFYMPLADYATNSTAFNTNVFIDTAITADTNGVIFFGFRTAGTAPPPLNTTDGGFARIAPDGGASYVLAGTAAGDSLAYESVFNCTPALSNDGTTLYAGVQGNGGLNYLLGLDATTLAPKFKVRLRDPRNGNSVGFADMSTASPTVGPDGDVFMGVSSFPDNGSRGFMLHFSADLVTNKIPSSFGWDYTAGIVPTNIVRGYKGTSSYLLVSKYNDYTTGNYRVALLDPNAPESAFGTNVMREVLTIQGPTTGREWCMNTPAVNTSTASVMLPSEDGRIYRWNLLSNSLVEALRLSGGYGEPYVPTVVGPDGAVYTINGSSLYAIDSLTNLAISAYSSAPDDRSTLIGQPITFTAVVTNPAASGPVPTGTVSFLDGSAVIATNVTLTNGIAATTTNLIGGAHFINVKYSGDTFYPTGMVTVVQRVHAKASSMVLNSTVPIAGSNSVTFTAVVSSPGGGTPTGMAIFWDGNAFLRQIPLSSGRASFTTTNLGVGSHAVQAEYSSDITYASCTGAVMGVAGPVTSVAALADGSLQLAFTNVSGAPYTILGSTDVSLALSDWQVLGPAVEILPGQFQFTDPQAVNYGDKHFYRVRSP
jgi:hypothetical protein